MLLKFQKCTSVFLSPASLLKGDLCSVYLQLVCVLVWIPPWVPPQSFSEYGVMQGWSSGTSEGYSEVKQHCGIQSLELWSGQTLRQRRPADHSLREALGCPANGTSTPGSTVPVTATHKRAQEDANKDEWPFFSTHSTLIRAFHLLWLCASPSTAVSIRAR